MKRALLVIPWLALAGCGATPPDEGDAPEVAVFLDAELAHPGAEAQPVSGWLMADADAPVYLTVQRFGDDLVLEGDILLDPSLFVVDQGSEGETTQPLAAISAERRWTNGRVPYVIDPDLPNKTRVTDAIKHWNAKTNVRFVKRNGQADYVYITKGPGCSAHIGKVGGKQLVRLAKGCTKGSAIHELGHAAGLWHEQSRADRAPFVNVRWKNIEAGKEDNFRTYAKLGFDGVDIGKYSYGSIMHYGSFAFSANGKPTIVKEDGSLIHPNRNVLSSRDIAQLSKLYPPP